MADPAFPLTIDDTSPIVLYQPFRDIFTAIPDLAAGWNQYYNISGFAQSPSGVGTSIGASTVGNGTSLHLTASDGAELRIDWNGTDITIFGTLTQAFSTDAPNLTYSVILDGTATTNFISHLSPNAVVETATTDILASFTGLTEGFHSLLLTLRNPGTGAASGNLTAGPILAFDRVQVQMGAGKPSSTAVASPSDNTTASAATASTSPVPDDQIAYRGQWSFTPGLLPDSTASFHTSNNVGDRATLMFNGSAVGLTGLTTPASGAYTVSLDSEDPVTLSSRASFTASAPTLLFFRTGLDPTVMHTLEVVNAGPAAAGDNAGSMLVLAAVNVTTIQSAGATPPGGTSSGLSKGTIAALAIGITLAVALVAVAAVCCARRRRRIARRKREMLVNPRISRAGRLSFLFPHKRLSHAGEKAAERESQGGQGVLHISSPNPDAPEKQDESDDEEDGDGDGTGEGTGEGGDEESHAQRFSAAEKGKARALRRSNASKNSDGSYSIDLPDLTIAQEPRGYLPTSMVPSTPSPPRTFGGSLPSPTSPRSSKPRGPREMQGRDSTRGILLTNMGPTSPGEDDADGEGRLRAPSYLPDAHISPLRVEFATELPERPDRRTERAISTGTAVSLPQSLQQALSEQRSSRALSASAEVPSPTRPEPVFSFLDFNNSSTSTSLSRTQRQSGTDSTGKSASSSSKRNTGSEHSTHSQTVNWASLPPDRRISLGLSMTVSGGPTASRPSLSPSVLLQPVPLPPAAAPPLPTIATDDQTLSSSSSDELEGPDQAFPYDAAGGQLPSPTDSIPFTVSDIHFRHSTQSSLAGGPESRRASAHRLSGAHRPPHPPLPGLPASPTSPTRALHAHHRGGSVGGSQTVPPFIVQRILGRTPISNPGTPFGSPIAPQFASIGSAMGRAAGAGAAGGSTSPPPVSVSAPASPQPAGGRGSGGGQQPTTGPGSGSASGPTVFGFQLPGRHR
ncbi:hypothetical protein TRAPUB_8013 [Trametes pubescens]|uniref:Uncharacterized protein n=1 Tax=Trametes pubescens TaxID=154538 RepID=A0A1M2W6E0_TRAPU|nr:hypothetical protein TRAPUB_8013 [Trametes pubescens]